MDESMVKLDLEIIISNSRHKKSMTLVTSRGRGYFQIPSNKVDCDKRTRLTFKFSVGWKYWLDHVRNY